MAPYTCTHIIIQIWNSKDQKNQLEWTSLRGNDHRTLLKNLPPHIPTILPGETGTLIMNLWKVQSHAGYLQFLLQFQVTCFRIIMASVCIELSTLQYLDRGGTIEFLLQ